MGGKGLRLDGPDGAGKGCVAREGEKVGDLVLQRGARDRHHLGLDLLAGQHETVELLVPHEVLNQGHLIGKAGPLALKLFWVHAHVMAKVRVFAEKLVEEVPVLLCRY